MSTPTYPVTQFTPAPTCGPGLDLNSALWAVSKTCYLTGSTLEGNERTVAINPDWVSCTIAQFGEPGDRQNTDCYKGYSSTTEGSDGIATYYSGCPVGYTVLEHQGGLPYYPYSRTYTRTSDGTVITTTEAASDVFHTTKPCCPSVDGLYFSYRNFPSSNLPGTTRDGYSWRGDAYLVPRCQVFRAEPLVGQTVTLTAYSDTLGWEKRKRQEQTEEAGAPVSSLVSELWTLDKDLWAEAEWYEYTTFADGHKCFESSLCDHYWSNYYTSGAQMSSLPVPGPSGTAPSSSYAYPTDSPGWNGTESSSAGAGTGHPGTGTVPTRTCPGGCSGPSPTASGTNPGSAVPTAAAPGSALQRGWALAGSLVLSVAVAVLAL